MKDIKGKQEYKLGRREVNVFCCAVLIAGKEDDFY
jgi:hypothetical protein